jgi:hypothetical protein
MLHKPSSQLSLDCPAAQNHAAPWCRCAMLNDTGLLCVLQNVSAGLPRLLSVLPLVLTCRCCAGEDLCFCVPNKIYSSQAYPDTAVCLRASTLGARRVAMPPLHKRLRCCDSALAAAQGKLYLLGGSCHLEVGWVAGCGWGPACSVVLLVFPSFSHVMSGSSSAKGSQSVTCHIEVLP